LIAWKLLRDAAAADDAVQASWVVVVRRIGTVKDPRSIGAWLCRIVANQCNDFIRLQAKRRCRETVDDSAQVADQTPDRQKSTELRTE